MRFGKQKEKGIVLDAALNPQVVDVEEHGEDKLMVFDETSEMCALVVSRLAGPGMPTPIGVMRAVARPTYEHMLQDQVKTAKNGGSKSVQDLLNQGKWVVA